MSQKKKQEAKPAKGITPCEALVAMRPQSISREKVVAVVGEKKVASMPQVAKQFGVSAATIRQSWRANGMPGTNGNYSLADITLWKIQHDKKNEKNIRHSQEEKNTSLQEIELESARVSLAIKKAKYQQNEGQLVSREEIRAEVYAMLAVFAKTLLEIPRAMLPILPKKIAASATAELEKLIRHALSALSEKTHRIYLKESVENE